MRQETQAFKGEAACTLSEARDADTFKGEAACVLSNTLKAGGFEAIGGMSQTSSTLIRNGRG